MIQRSDSAEFQKQHENRIREAEHRHIVSFIRGKLFTFYEMNEKSSSSPISKYKTHEWLTYEYTLSLSIIQNSESF
jgi:hypothetical protein